MCLFSHHNTLYFSDQCSSIFTMFSTALQRCLFSRPYLVISLFFQQAMFRYLHYVLYLIDAYFLLTCIFLMFSVGSALTASLCFVPYWFLFSHSLTFYFLCVFSGQCFGSFAIFCTLLMPIVSLSYHVFSLCFQWTVFRQLHYVIYRISACFLIMAWVLADFLHEAATFYSEDYSVWFIFATIWSFMMLALSSLLQAIYAIYYLLHVEHGGESSNRNIRVFYLTRLPHRQGR